MSALNGTKSAHRSLLSGAVLIGMALVVVGSAAPAQASIPNKHDGRWSIEVITEKGDCDRAYRYSVLVENGEARYGGSEPIKVRARSPRAGPCRAASSTAITARMWWQAVRRLGQWPLDVDRKPQLLRQLERRTAGLSLADSPTIPETSP
jgi:hypothetical protein